jgi:hypothetical protein
MLLQSLRAGRAAALIIAGVLMPAVPLRSPAQTQATEIGRWVGLDTASIGARYFFIDNTSGVRTNSEMQHNISFKARWKFDRDERFSLNVGVFTGNNFAGGWNSSGWGTSAGDGSLFLKQLYLSAKPVRDLEFQYGGLPVVRGEMTDIVSYSGDGYVTGERMIVSRPKELFFDQVAVTYAYLGDINQPGMNKRFRRLAHSNYHQFLAAKNLGQRAAVSVDYTFQSGAETMREGIRVNTKELAFVDWIRFDNYQRIDVNPDHGFGLHGEKALSSRFSLGGGYVDIDPNYGDLNSDAFFHGRRLYASSTLKLHPALSLSCLWNRAVANHYFIANRTHLHVILQYDVLKGFRH